MRLCPTGRPRWRVGSRTTVPCHIHEVILRSETIGRGHATPTVDLASRRLCRSGRERTAPLAVTLRSIHGNANDDQPICLRAIYVLIRRNKCSWHAAVDARGKPDPLAGDAYFSAMYGQRQLQTLQ